MAHASSADITSSTRYCAVVGQPIRHSASPAMQNAGMTALGLDWRYLALEVPPTQLRDAIAGARAMRFIGLNLTVPHKLLALDLVDHLDPSAREWGAVNTIRFEGRSGQGDWLPLAQMSASQAEEVRAVGFNTDAQGLLRALDEDLAFRAPGGSAIVLGAGGAGRVAALQLAAAGAREIHLVNRSASKAEALAVEIRQRWPGCASRAGFPEHAVDLLINATSVGLGLTDGLPFPASHFSLAQVRRVFDMIYWPLETPLLREARATGCQIANGLGMLLHQGALALELWCGQPAPHEIMRTALVTHLQHRAAETACS